MVKKQTDEKFYRLSEKTFGTIQFFKVRDSTDSNGDSRLGIFTVNPFTANLDHTEAKDHWLSKIIFDTAIEMTEQDFINARIVFLKAQLNELP